MEIGLLRPSTLPQVTPKVVHIGLLKPATLPLVIAEGILVEVDLGHKRPATLLLIIGEQEVMFQGEVNISLRPATIPPITKVNVVDFLLHQYIYIVSMKRFTKKRRVILDLTMVDVAIGLNIPEKFSLTIRWKVLVMMGELDIGPIPSTLHYE